MVMLQGLKTVIQYLDQNRLRRPIAIVVLWMVVSAVAYVISYLIYSDFYGTKIGFPYTIYESFHIRGHEFLHFNWDIKAAIKNEFIYLMLAVVFQFLWSLKKSSSKTKP